MAQKSAARTSKLFAMHARKRSALVAASVLAPLAAAGCGGSAKGASTASTAAAGARATSTAAPAAPSPAPPADRGSGTVTGSSSGVAASMRAGTHHPRAGRPWPVRFIVTRAGKEVAASVSYEFLFAGQVVARRSHYTFRGRFSDIVTWPSSAVGYPLTFRAVIASAPATINLDYPVRVSR